MKLHLGLKLRHLLTLILIGGFCATTQAEVDSESLVEVHYRQDVLAPYKERRPRHGSYVGVSYESLILKNYISTLDGSTYGNLFGELSIPLVILDFDYKFNFDLGSLAAGLNYGMGTVESDKIGEERSLEATKYGVSFKFTLDALMEEPYVAPYVGLNIWQMVLSEKSPSDSFSGTTQMGMNYTFGALIQLNWLDWRSAKESTIDWGLENTFLDIFATQYAKTESEGDPNTETDLLYGAGLRLEF